MPSLDELRSTSLVRWVENCRYETAAGSHLRGEG